MNRFILCAMVGGILLSTVPATAVVRYVDANSTNAAPPYTNWAAATTNIQAASDVATTGDQILVTNGTYAPVSVVNPIVLRSVNGPGFTVINGGGAIRCVYLTNDASLSGFTLTNSFADYGGGVRCASASVWIANCMMTGKPGRAAGWEIRATATRRPALHDRPLAHSLPSARCTIAT